MKKTPLFIAVILLLAGCAKEPAGRQKTGAEEETAAFEDIYVKGEVKVRFSDTMAAEIENELAGGVPLPVKSQGLVQVLDLYGVTSLTRLFPDGGEYEARLRREGLHKWYKAAYSEQKAVTRAVGDLSALEGVELAEPVLKAGGRTVFNDPKFSMQWDFLNDGSLSGKHSAGADINVVPVWENYTRGSSFVTVGVIDGGIDCTHPDLAANYARGYNFVENNTQVVAHEHGTHVAGTIAAVNNNGIGVCGIAGGDAAAGIAGVRLLSCEIFQTPADGGDDVSADAETAIVWAADHGANIINNSWGYNFSSYWQAKAVTIPESLREAIDYFIKYAGCDADGNQKPDSPMKGGLVVFAAGNDGWDVDPIGMYDPVVAVGAMAPDFSRAYYSNYGGWVDICAPGGDAYFSNGKILSTLPGGEYGALQGTSMACPHVTGVAALILSQFGGPGFTADRLKMKLLGGSRSGAVAKSEKIGDIVDAYASMTYEGGAAPDPVSDLSAEGKRNTVVLSFRASADPDDGAASKYAVYYGTDRSLLEALDMASVPDGVSVAFVYPDEADAGEMTQAVISGLSYGTEYFFRLAAVDKTGERSELSAIVSAKTENNKPPVISTDYTGDYKVKRNASLSVSFSISDPEGHSFSVETDGGSKAAMFFRQTEGYRLDINGRKADPGKYAATLKATDAYGACSVLEIEYEIVENDPPVLEKEFPGVYSQTLGERFTVDPAGHIVSPDGEALTWSVASSDLSVAKASVSDGMVLFSVTGFGTASLIVTGTDSFGKSASGSFMMLVKNPYETVETFPNPCTDFLTVRTGYEKSTRVRLYSESGRTVYDSTSPVGALSPLTISMKGRAPGGYVIKVEIEGEDAVERRIVKL